ncbi:MAG: helix-turn-helix transcriptional regulator [Hyphomicrobium sp.]|uniref:S24 family peptidase n=1 Tax=Hyphomicrobium sp. TaxID=82 RepID=UPI003D0AD004
MDSPREPDSGNVIPFPSCERMQASDPVTVMYMLGDSMEPTIKSHDAVLIDRSVNRLIGEGVYAFHYRGMRGDTPAIGRLSPIIGSGGRRVFVTFDNKVYSGGEASVDDLEIVGMVIGFGRRL